MKLTVLCLFAALTAGAQSTTQHVPVTDIEKTADALRAGPQFITDDATILDCRPKRAANFEFSVEGGVNGLACRVHHPAPRMTSPDASIKFFFQWATDGLAGRPQHIDRLGVAYMYTGAWVPNWPGETKKEFHVALTLWSSLRVRRNCRVSAAMGRTART